MNKRGYILTLHPDLPQDLLVDWPSRVFEVFVPKWLKKENCK